MLSDLRTLSLDARQLVLPKPALATTATVNSAAYEYRENERYEWSGARRRIPFVLLQHTLSGIGHLRYDKREMALVPGTTMLLQFPHDNRYWLADGDAWEFFWIALSGPEVLNLWRRMLLTLGPVHRLSARTIDALAAKLMDILRLQDIRPQRLQAEARSICDLLSRDLLGERLREFSAHESQLAIDLQLAVDLLHNQEGSPLQVAELASSLGYSRHYFSRAFKQFTGRSPVDYRDEIRMHRAAELLRQTDSPVKLVAQACGYNDPNYFAKVFRRRFGKSPRAHRAG